MGTSEATLNVRAPSHADLIAAVTEALLVAGDLRGDEKKPGDMFLRSVRVLLVDGWGTVIDSKHRYDDLGRALSRRWSPTVWVEPADAAHVRVVLFRDGTENQSLVLPVDMAKRDETKRKTYSNAGLPYDDAVDVVRRTVITHVYTPASERINFWSKVQTL
jgi:hypothetical protein